MPWKIEWKLSRREYRSENFHAVKSIGVMKEASRYEILPAFFPRMSPVDRAGLVTGMNFALGSYEKFQPGFRDEKRSKILGTSSGAKFGKQSKHSETQKF